MCLAVPGRVVAIARDEFDMPGGVVQFGGIRKDVCLAFLPEAQVGDFVIVHAGFAIRRIDESEAAAALELLRGMGDAAEPAGEDPAGSGGDAVR